MFRVKIGKKKRKNDATAYQYDVAIAHGAGKKNPTGAGAAEKERTLPTPLCQRIFQTGLSNAAKQGQHGLTLAMFNGIAYDGRKAAFSMNRLPADELSVEANVGESGSDRDLFTLTVTLVSQVDLGVLELFCQADRQVVTANQQNVLSAVQALDILLRHGPAKTHKIHGAGGKRFYDGDNPRNVVRIRQGAEIWKGFLQSARPTITGMVVNLDVAFSAFLTGGKMTEVASHVLGKAGGGGFGGGRNPPLHSRGPQKKLDPSDVLTELRTAGKAAMTQAKGRPPQLLIVFLDAPEPPIYEAIKRICALELPVPAASQVLQTRKAFKEQGQLQYCANVGMKINIKLGGLNSAIEPRDLPPKVTKDAMMIGLDVTHAGPGSGMPSIVGSVASIDPNSGKFSNQIRLQHNPDNGLSQEIILDLYGVMKDHLNGWKKYHQNKLPTTIAVFRDGISEGQFAAAQKHEITAIKKACKAIDPKYSPKLTYLECTKRHNVRFFAANASDNDRSGNLPAGTVVDKEVVHPFAFEYYLQSKAGLLGTARPSKNVMLLDENNFTSDEMQRLSYSLTYGYSRATRSVSTAPLAYYSDILCEKARLLIYNRLASKTCRSRRAAPRRFLLASSKTSCRS